MHCCLQDTDLAEEPVWAHPTEHTEPGTVLLASAKAPGLLKDPRMWQVRMTSYCPEDIYQAASF